VFKLIITVVIVLLALWAVGMYNGLIKLRNLVQEAWPRSTSSSSVAMT